MAIVNVMGRYIPLTQALARGYVQEQPDGRYAYLVDNIPWATEDLKLEYDGVLVTSSDGVPVFDDVIQNVRNELIFTENYPFDPSGTHPENRVVEYVTLTDESRNEFNCYIPRFAPFFEERLVIRNVTEGKPPVLLEPGLDYHLTINLGPEINPYNLADKRVYACIIFDDVEITGTYEITYQTLGGGFTLNDVDFAERVADYLHNPLEVTWGEIVGKPLNFFPERHGHHVNDLDNIQLIVDPLKRIAALIENQNNQEEGYKTLLQDAVEIVKEYKRRRDAQDTSIDGMIAAQVNPLKERVEASEQSINEIKNTTLPTYTPLTSHNADINRVIGMIDRAKSTINGQIEPRFTALNQEVTAVKNRINNTLIPGLDTVRTLANNNKTRLDNLERNNTTALQNTTNQINETKTALGRQIEAGDNNTRNTLRQEFNAGINNAKTAIGNDLAGLERRTNARTDQKIDALRGQIPTTVNNTVTSAINALKVELDRRYIPLSRIDQNNEGAREKIPHFDLTNHRLNSAAGLNLKHGRNEAILNYDGNDDVVSVNTHFHARSISHSSDRRLKKNITFIDEARLGMNSLLDKLNIVHYQFNGPAEDHVRTGYIAQEVKDLVPDYIEKDKSGYYVLDESSLQAHINAEVRLRLQALERIVNAQSKLIKHLLGIS